MKLYTTINVYLHINPCPIKTEAYENEIYYTLNKSIDDERVCVFVSTSDYEKRGQNTLLSTAKSILQKNNF